MHQPVSPPISPAARKHLAREIKEDEKKKEVPGETGRKGEGVRGSSERPIMTYRTCAALEPVVSGLFSFLSVRLSVPIVPRDTVRLKDPERLQEIIGSSMSNMYRCK